jgi:hypothetical protein
MAENKIDIEVNLTGTKQAEKGLDKLQNAGNAVGETFSGMTQAVKTTGGEFGEQLGAIGESASNLGSTFMTLGKSVGSGFTAMLGPIGMVVLAIYELAQAVEEYDSEVSGATIKSEAYAASVAEMTSLIEGLADAEVRLTYVQLKRLSQLASASQLPIEEAQGIRESNKERVRQIALIDNLLKKLDQIRKKGNLGLDEARMLAFRAAKLAPGILKGENMRNALIQKRAKLQAKNTVQEEKALQLQLEGADRRRLLEIERKALEKTSPKFQRELQAKELDIIQESILAKGEAQKDSLEMQRKAAVFASEKRLREISLIEDISEGVRAEARAGEQAKLNATLRKIDQDHYKKIKEARNRRAKEIAAEDAKEAQLRRKALTEAFQIRLLEIEQMKLNGATAEEVTEARYKAELELADDNANRRLMVDMRYQNQRLAIQAEADAKAEEERKRQEEHRRNFILESQEFDISMMEQLREKMFSEEFATRLGLSAIMEQGIDQELAALDFKYRQEIEMKERSEEEITELTRRYNLERQAIQERAVNAQIDGIAQLTSTIGAGFAQAGYASIFFGESFKDSAAQVIKGLGQQAAVEALMNTAKGLAAAVLNPAAAGGYFAAAGVFGAAATAAGLASSALGGGGGGGGGASAVSPTGSPQTAPTPEREQAESSSMVFNINFGGAVIYDSKQAAEQAMADRITRLQNVQRRGAPRRRS